MFEYISCIRTKLPAAAAKGWEFAKKVRSGTANPDERAQVLAVMWDYIIRNEGPVTAPAPQCCITRAMNWLVRDLSGPGEDEYVSEVVHWFLFFANKFEDHSADAAELVQRCFSPQPTAENAGPTSAPA